MNVLLIQEQNRAVPYSTVDTIYEELMKEIMRAMAAETAGPMWPRYLTHPKDTPQDAQEKLNAKKLTKSSLQAKVLPISNPPRPLLQQITEINPRPLSALEQKLIVGGASSQIIEKARLLRANAQTCWITQRSQNPFMTDDLLEDLRQRLETHAITKRALHRLAQDPANAIFDALLGQFSLSPSSIDPNNIMYADPMLLLGETCELAELCRIDWGVADA